MRLSSGWILVTLVACQRGPATAAPTPVPSIPTPNARSRHLQVLDEIHQVLQENYIFEDYLGTDWLTEYEDFKRSIGSSMDDDDFYEGLESLLSQLPDGTISFITREERISADLSESSTYEGIGAFVAYREDPIPRIILLSVIEESPAEEAGLRAHDAIYEINGEPITAEEGLGAVERIRGPEGTEVLLLVSSPDGTQREIPVTRRGLIATDSIKGNFLNTGDVHLLVPTITDLSLLQALDSILQDMQGKEYERQPGLILDLRIAQSGDSWPLEEVLTILSDGNHGEFYYKDGREPLIIEGQDISGSQNIPLVLLIGPDTRGVPEILAGALQATGRATLVGMETSGGVYGYQSYVLSNGSELIFANSSYETSNGLDLGYSGLTPDMGVEADWDQISLTLDPMLSAALMLLETGQ